jgi:hypothetical protein
MFIWLYVYFNNFFRDKNAPFRADTVFEKMLEAGVQPDTMAWTILITIWSRSKLVEKENKVQDIFMRQVQLVFYCVTVKLVSLLPAISSSPEDGR